MTKLSGPMVPPQSGAAPRQAVVLLHGYGSDGADLIGLVPYFQPLLPEALFLAPNAPVPASNVGFGFQWFPIDFNGDRLASRQTGVLTAQPVLAEFLADLWAQSGVAPRDTLLIGFSQGAMLALHAGLSLPEPLAGIVAFSGAFLAPEGFAQSGGNKTPVCLVHGDLDDVVAPELSAEAARVLASAGVPVEYHVSVGTAHGIAPDGLQFAAEWIAARLP